MDTFFNQPLEVNDIKDLARVYRHLVEPMSKIETKIADRDDKQNKLGEAEKTLKCAFFTPFILGLTYTLKYAIPFVVLFIIFIIFKKNPEGVRYISAYPDWFIVKFKALDNFGLFLQAHLGMFFGSILAIVISFLVIFAIGPTFLFLFPVMLVVALVLSIREDIIATGRVNSYPSKIKALDAEIDADMNVISQAIELVPPDYRSSDAIEFMCKAIESCKAESLKEAMLQYDEHEFREEMRDSQKHIISLVNRVLENQEIQNQKLDTINKNINRVNSKLNWMIFFN